MKFSLNLLVGMLMLPFISFGQSTDYSALEQQFEQSKILPTYHYGFSLYDMDEGKYVFGRKEDNHFTPASNTKVFTLFSSLKNLPDSIAGIHYVERGDSLIFWGTGDPTFLHPELDTRVVYEFLKNSNKKLYYATQQSTEPAYRNGWSVEDFQYYYQPEISIFPIYGNVVKFRAKGRTVSASPAYFDRCVEIKEKPSRNFFISRDINANRFVLSNTNVPSSFSATKPFLYSDELLIDLLRDTLKKDVVLLKDYPRCSDIKTLNSTSRNIVLRKMMLPSDNFLAEHLTMLASDKRFNGFYTDSLRNVLQQEYYQSFPDTVELRDGSGLSAYNKVSPRTMVELLLLIDKEAGNEFQRNMFFPTGGVDGTLRSAYSLDQGAPFVWAKTGTLNAVHCQSGYIVTRSGKRYAFSFLNNNYMMSTATVRREMVKIVTFIRQNY